MDSMISALFIQYHQEISNKNYEKALAIISKVIELDSNNLDFREKKFYLLKDDLYRFTEALDEINFIIDRQKANPSLDIDDLYDLYKERAYIFEALGNYTETINDINRVMKHDIAYMKRSYIWRLSLQVQLELYEDIINDLKQVEKHIQLSDIAYHVRHGAYNKIGRYDLALNDINRAIELGMSDSILYLQRGLIHAKLNQWDECLKDINKYLEINNKPIITNMEQLSTFVQKQFEEQKM